jgi:hypothetical protein
MGWLIQVMFIHQLDGDPRKLQPEWELAVSPKISGANPPGYLP